ncbi:MAG TPA: hypothetical protein VGY13_10260 [Solirubrobacteraceae bacterium]|jgi:hypothetical protein|nr:hypothetical protein [Solirubrobacteraceae bacterium]
MNVAKFAEKVLYKPLWPHQRRLVEDTHFYRVVSAGRRSGKTETAQVEGMHTAFSNAGCKVVILSAGQDSARRVTEDIGAELNAHPLTRGAVVDDYATRIRLTNDSEIISLPASQRQVRGLGKGVLLLVMDEAGFQPEELWPAARFIALDERANGSRILLLGGPWGKGFFRNAYLLGSQQDPDYASFSWTMSMNPTLDAAFIERERSRMSRAEAAAELDGVWGDAVGSLFSQELLESCTADIVVPRYQDLRGPATGVLGIDWGVSYDCSSLAGIFRLPVAALNADAEPMPRFVALSYGWKPGEPLHHVIKATVSNIAPFRHVATEVNGVGAYPSSEVRRLAVQSRTGNHDRTKRRWFFISTTAATKTTGYSLLLGMLERGQLVLPRDPDLLRQLAGLRFEQRERGFVHIAAEDAASHDDHADSLMLATLPYKPPRQHRVICHLAALAGSLQAPADARVPALACGTVTTGGGLVVPERPTLQSVGSEAWTAYAPVQAPRPEGFQAGKYFVKTTQGVTHAT